MTLDNIVDSSGVVVGYKDSVTSEIVFTFTNAGKKLRFRINPNLVMTMEILP
jgi:hypothetical protein